ncbi:uncharacterized protein AMSG_01676 [Thecamonas trahens ATCC 50062]|uniref:Kinase n=1 Tax=Thecamonas trahens ATCC 50062 TaxID=461836 RepID=A0A0L0DTM3_THETB|nr:hypothetical protein AMSG_01676 [Thecamonas trahens ATCC 50062]KNC54823.1 hypothetical protein AMSG_01676 [Thecamonas trahens ATCC 50062]|eukprot:XP_013761722.1 hypothetical protein AMSG_01676 [Thecamonas trahens ATCC 50062]
MADVHVVLTGARRCEQQLAGHDGILQGEIVVDNKAVQVIAKPLHAREAAFYAHLTGPSPPADLARFVPDCFAAGPVTVAMASGETTTTELLVVADLRGELGGRYALADCKLGFREAAPLAVTSAEKTAIQTAKALGTTSATLGVRLLGLHAPRLDGSWVTRDKAYGRSLDSPASLSAALAGDLLGSASAGQLKQIRSRIGDLRDALASTHSVKLFSASILIGYAPGGCADDVTVALVDFANSLCGVTADDSSLGVDHDSVDALGAVLDTIDAARHGYTIGRAPVDADAAALAALVNDVYVVAERGLWQQGFQRTTAVEIEGLIRGDKPETQVLMAVGNASARPILGIIAVSRVDYDGDRVGEFGMLAVAPAARSAGLGRALIDAAEAHAAATWGVSTMMLELLTPRNFVMPDKVKLTKWYTALGYTPCAPMPFEDKLPQLVPFLDTEVDFTVFLKQLSGET